MIKEEDLIPGTKAKYGIEFESIIVDISNKDYICISDDRLYDTSIDKSVTNNINKFMENLADFDIPDLFKYVTSGLNCDKPPRSDKRLEFASYALSPTNRKPSELFNTLERMIDAFNQWTGEKYYLPDHGTISFLSDDKEQVYTTLTGGTHMTISFPLTKTDNPVTWKYFMWLFTGLVTMYQPIYVALNGAPSYKTKGSERQRTSGSIVIGSAYIYDIFTPESERYEIFINTPDGYHLPDYPEYAHWNDKDLSYKESGPWRGGYKADIGNSNYTRSDSFKLFHRNDFITDDKEKVLNKQFYEKYETLIHSIASMTSNLIEFRFFDNEPIQHLHNKFNLLIRMADYAYEQTKNMEAAIGVEGLKKHSQFQIDNRLNIRPLVNKKPWHDAVLESMNEGLDATFNEEFIDECYEFLSLTPFSTLLENPELKEISAIDLNKVFIDEMNTAEHHFSEYFQTNNPTSDYSKEYQIEKLNDSKLIAEEKMKVYAEEKARKDEAERQRKEKSEGDQRNIIIGIITTNISTLDYTLTNIINDYIDIVKLAEKLRYKIYVDNDTLKELIKYGAEETIEDSLLNSTSDENLIKTLNEWIKESLLPDLREKEPRLRDREDTEDRNREREIEREQRLQREREKIEEQINFIANIITKNITNITDETLQGLVLTTIHLRKLSDTLRKSIYVNKASIQYITDTVGTTIFVSTLDDVSMINLNDESKIMLYKWFIESLLPDLESNIPELRERSQPQTITGRIIPQTEADKKGEIYQIIVKTVNRLNNVSQHAVVTTILYTKLVDILYHRIYVVQQSFNEIEEISELIINDAKPENTTRTFEQDDIVRAWFKVGLLSELRETLLTRPQVIETRNNSSVIEHRHTSNDYWHPATRIHAAQTDIPSGHVPNIRGWDSLDISPEQSTPPVHGESEMITLYAFSEDNVMNNYIDEGELPEGFKLCRDINLAEQEYYNENPRSPNVILYRIEIATNDLRSYGGGLFTTARPTSRIEIKIEPSETQLIQTRTHRDVIEHIHPSNDYWHPATRIHAESTNIPIGHIPNIRLQSSLDITPETSSEISEETVEQIRDDQISVIFDIIINNTSQLVDDELERFIYNSLNYKKLATVLQKMIFDEHLSEEDIKVNVDIIITQTLQATARDLDTESIRRLENWLKTSLVQSLINESLLEKNETQSTLIDPVSDEKDLIYESMIESIKDLDDNTQRIITMYIDQGKLVDEIYIRIKDDYSTSQIKGMASLITQTSIFDNATIPENKKEIIDAWFVAFLIPQLIKDDILNPLQEIEEVPTTYTAELEAVESEERIENETSIILDIIKLNIENLENHTLKDIIKKYIIYSYFATSLHTMIYQKHYTTIDIENNMDILLSEGFYDEDNETYVQDSEVIKLLVTWITDYLIPDLVKGTSLQFGGIGALFG